MGKEARIKVTEISCDGCWYIDSPEKFPDVYTLKGEETLKKFGYDLSYQSLGIGIICPVCGNISEFDFDPDNKRGKGLLEIVYEEV